MRNCETQIQKDGIEDDAKAKKQSGYSVRIGDMKGVVQACDSKMKPSMKDDMEIYDVVNDPFETTNVAKKSPDLVKKFKTLVVSKDLSCRCYQC